MQSFTARVSEHTILATTFHFLHLELVKPNLINFQAGQFISLLIDKNSGLRRSYSITSVPSVNHAIDLLVNIAPGGPGSQYIQNLQPGEEVEFTGPMGNLVIKSQESRVNSQIKYLLIATGCGIAPVRSMILDQLVDKRNQNKIRLWWGMRYEEDCFWEEDFDLLEKEHPNFKWDLVLSKPSSGWPLHQGHITEYLIDYIKNLNSLSQLSIYLCSYQQVVDEISTKLKETGIKNEQIYFEKFS